MPDQSVLEMIGQFVRHNRLNQNKSQTQIAEAAGISRSTLSLMERGETVRMDSFIQVLRVLGLLGMLSVFQTGDQISPLAYARLKRKERKRASNSSEATDQTSEWGW